MMRQYELVETVRDYDPSADEDLLNRAYVYAMKMHGSQKRASGDPYYSHPLEVAGILTDLKLDHISIIAALLHDTVEDTEATLKDIERLFGSGVARLVDGVTKLTRLEMQSKDTHQAENFRKFLLAISSDIRTLLIKLADRLHNMRTLHYIKKPEKRQRIAQETLDIYAPLAERIGLQAFKDELEDLGFRYNNPEANESILARMRFLREDEEDGLIDTIALEIKQHMQEEGVDCTVSGREKRPYSIWRKMQDKHVPFEQLTDIMAFRIVVNSIEDCYRALGIIHGSYKMIPDRFKDYISIPKANGYQSIHTAVIGPARQRVEVQIRTQEMHRVAEYGVAAHWDYKQHTGDSESKAGVQYRWVRELLEMLDHGASPEEFLEHTKLEMFPNRVFCFTPAGECLALPAGSCPIDFAYAVHTRVGDTCVGAKINGRMVPLKTVLKNGDQVEILRSKNQTPNPDWENYVVTGKARSGIRRFIRQQEKEQYAALGRAMLVKYFGSHGYTFSDKAVEGILKIFRHNNVDELYVQVGKGNTSPRDVIEAVYPAEKEKDRPKSKDILTAPHKSKVKPDSPVAIRGLIPGMAVHYAGCCHPLPGDRIVGIVTTGKGVTIHTIDCESLANYQNEPERWIDVGWEQEGEPIEAFVGRLHLVVSNEKGALSAVTQVISRHDTNISNIKVVHRTAQFYELLIDLDVRDVKHLSNVTAALRADPVINAVDRVRG